MNCARLGLLARLLVITGAAAMLGGCVSLEFSPDGSRLLFSWVADGDRVLAAAKADGSQLRIVSMDDAGFARWSPDGNRIAFADSKGVHIHDIRTGRSTPALIPEGLAPSWTPGGDKVLALLETDEKPMLVTFDIASRTVTNRQPLTEDLEGFPPFVHLPASDGVAYVSKGNVRIAEFGEDRQVTTTGDIVGFGLEPGGKRLVFARKTKNPRYILLSLYRYDLELRSVQKLPFPDRVAGVNPSPRNGPEKVEFVMFSPDAQDMLVLTTKNIFPPEKQPATTWQQIFRIDIRGSAARSVWAGPHHPIPTWAPDGKTIALLFEKQVMLVDDEGRKQREIAFPRNLGK